MVSWQRLEFMFGAWRTPLRRHECRERTTRANKMHSLDEPSANISSDPRHGSQGSHSLSPRATTWGGLCFALVYYQEKCSISHIFVRVRKNQITSDDILFGFKCYQQPRYANKTLLQNS